MLLNGMKGILRKLSLVKGNNMNKSACSVFLIGCFLFPLVAWDYLNDLVRIPGAHTDGDAINVVVLDSPLKAPLLGIGVQFDPFFFSHNVTMGNGASIEDWDSIIVPRVQSMRIQRYRVCVLPQWWEPYNDNDNPFVANDSGFTWDSYDMQSLYKLLDLAEETKAEVNLVLWGCPVGASLSTGGKHIKYIEPWFLSSGRKHWVTGPKDPEEFAENFVALLIHLIKEKKYTCIKEITPFNEPESKVVETDMYIRCFKAIHKRLLDEGLRESISMIASDNIESNQWFLKACVDSLSGIADIYDSHLYAFGSKSKKESIKDWELNNIKIVTPSGKTHFVGEFGTNDTQVEAFETFERGVQLSRIAIELLNAGAVSVSYWCLDDHFTNTESSYDNMMKSGLWRYINKTYSEEAFYSPLDDDYHVRPQYYAYSLLTRFIRKGDVVYPTNINESYISSIALKHHEGNWTYFFVNSTINNYSLLFTNSLSQAERLNVLLYKEEELPLHGKQITVSNSIEKGNKGVQFVIPSNSITVLEEVFSSF